MRACYVVYAHTFHIVHVIADTIEYGTESFDGKEILDNLIVEGLKKLVNNLLNVDTWPGRLPFQTVESIPGHLPGSGRSPFI